MFIWTCILSLTWGNNAPFSLFAAPAEDNAAQGVPADQAPSQYWTNHITFSSKQSHIHHVCINMTVAAPGGRNTARSASNNPLSCTGPQALWVRFVITATRVSLWRKSPHHHYFFFFFFFWVRGATMALILGRPNCQVFATAELIKALYSSNTTVVRVKPWIFLMINALVHLLGEGAYSMAICPLVSVCVRLCRGGC